MTTIQERGGLMICAMPALFAAAPSKSAISAVTGRRRAGRPAGDDPDL